MFFREKEIERRLKAGWYGTVETCDTDTPLEQAELKRLYRQNIEAGNCYVYWGPVSNR